MQGDNFELEKIRQAAYEGALEGAKKVKHRNAVGGILIKLLIAVAIIMLLPFALSKLNPLSKIADQFSLEEPVENHDMTLENNGVLGYSAADFADAILGDSTKLKCLEVYSQEMSEMVTFTKAGLGKLKIFSKSKNYTYNGTATYVVDLSKMTADAIELDEENNTVILYIPHAELPDNNINVPLEKVVIGDTTKGLLSPGDLNLSDEESQKLMEGAKEKMKKKLEEENIQETADKVAEMTVWEMFQPLISNVAPGYTLKIEFSEIS